MKNWKQRYVLMQETAFYYYEKEGVRIPSSVTGQTGGIHLLSVGSRFHGCSY